MKRSILFGGLFVTALVAVLIVIILTTKPLAPVQVGDTAPNLPLVGAFGGEGELKDYRGKTVILNFWATWCAPCIEEMPSLQMLYELYRGDDFEIIAVSLDQEGKPVVQQFAETNELTFALTVDPEGLSEHVFRLTGLPETYIIDAEGIVRYKELGPRDWADAKSVAVLEEILGHGPRRRLVQREARSPNAVTETPPAVNGK